MVNKNDRFAPVDTRPKKKSFFQNIGERISGAFKGITKDLDERIAAEFYYGSYPTELKGVKERKEKGMTRHEAVLDLYRETDLPPGFKGALETAPLMAVPGAVQTRAALMGRAAALSASKTPLFRAAGAGLKTAATIVKPAAKVEELTGKAIALPFKGVKKVAGVTPGLRRLVKPSAETPFEKLYETDTSLIDDEDIARAWKGESAGPETTAMINNIAKRLTLESRGESGTSLITGPRHIQEILSHIKTLPEGAARKLAMALGGKRANPNAFLKSEIAKIAAASRSQQLMMANKVEIALIKIFDKRANLNLLKGELDDLIPMDAKGMFKGTKAFKGGKIEVTTGHHYSEIIENPNDSRWKDLVSDDLRGAISEIRIFMDDLNIIRISNGLKPLPLSQGRKAGWYFPHVAKGIDGIQLPKTSDPHMARVYELAAEGMAEGIEYSTNVREIMKAHARVSMEEVLAKQLADAIEPLTFLPSKLIAKPLYQARVDTLSKLRRVEHEVRREIQREFVGKEKAKAAQRQLKRGELGEELEKLLAKGKGKRTIEESRRMGAVRKRINTLLKEERDAKIKKPPMPSTVEKTVKDRLKYDEVKKAYQKAKTDYSKALEGAKRKNRVTGTMFGLADEAPIPISLWRGKFMPREAFEEANEHFSNILVEYGYSKKNQGIFEQVTGGAEKLVNYSRMMAATLDAALPFIHGFPMLVRHPIKWAQGTLLHYRGFTDSKLLGRLVDDNYEDFMWLADHGIGVDSELFVAMEKGGGFSAKRLSDWLDKDPTGLVKKGRKALAFPFTRSQRAYNTGLAAYRVKLLQSLKKNWYSRGGTDEELAAHIRNMTGGLDSRALGVGPTQRSIESMWLAFSPRLLRSTVALLSDAVRGGAGMAANVALRPLGKATNVKLQQREAFRTVGTFLAAVHGFFITAAVAHGKVTGKSDEEIAEFVKRGLNPLEGKRYLSLQHNGDWIGVGGQIRGLMQFMAKSVDALRPGGAPIEDFLSADQFENPLINFYMNRGAPAVRAAGTLVEGISGIAGGSQINALPYDHIDGLPDMAKHLGQSALPFTIQGRMEGEKALTTLFAFGGMRTSPESPSERRNRLRDQEVANAFSKGLLDDFIGELTPEQKAKVAQGSYDTLDRDAKAIVNNLPNVKSMLEGYEQQRRDLGDQYQDYKDERKEVLDSYKNAIEKDARTLEPHEFREEVTIKKRLRAIELSHVEDRHQEALEFFADLEPSENRFDIALTHYYESVTNAPDLEDPETGKFNFDRLNANKQKFQDRWGENLTRRIEDHIRAKETAMEKELRAARELLKEYWEAPPILDPNLKREWDKYVKQKRDNPTMAQMMRQRFPILRRLEKYQRRVRDRLRQNPEIDAALVKWYPRVARTALGFEVAEQLGQADFQEA